MLSVIVPTMWRHEPFLDFLKLVLEQDSVGEVIIINNDVSVTPESEVLSHEKIRMHNCEKNIYVAPAWNLGAELARFDKFCFLSDDVNVNIDVFNRADEFLKPEIGMVSLLVDDREEHSYLRFLTDNTINFVSSNHPVAEERPPPVGIGCLFFVNRSDYTPIPVVKIFHGEVMLWKRIATAKQNYIIINCKCETPWHVTVNSLSENRETATIYTEIQHADQEAAFGANSVRF